MSTTKVGQRVTIKGKEEEYGEGTVKFVGIVKFDTGKWVGIELDKPLGKHDGIVKGERYFQTKPNHAVFTKYGQTNLVSQPTATSSSKKTSSIPSTGLSAAKKVANKVTSVKSSASSTPIASKVSSPATSTVHSTVNSAAPSPPNELEDTIEEQVEQEETFEASSNSSNVIESPSRTSSPSIQKSTSETNIPGNENSTQDITSDDAISETVSQDLTTKSNLEMTSEDLHTASQINNEPKPDLDVVSQTNEELEIKEESKLGEESKVDQESKIETRIEEQPKIEPKVDELPKINEPQKAPSNAVSQAEPVVTKIPEVPVVIETRPTAVVPTAQVAPQVSQVTSSVVEPQTTKPKVASTPTPTKLSSPKKPTPASSSKIPAPKINPTPPKSVPIVDDSDEGESAYELDLKMKTMASRIDALETENDKLKTSNARLESQITILKEGSEAILAQQQSGGMEWEKREAEFKLQIKELKSKLDSSMDHREELELYVSQLESQIKSINKSNTDAINSSVAKAVADLKMEMAKMKNEYEERIDTLSTDLEMVTMDKEIAEEERDAFMKEVEQIKLEKSMLESYKQAMEDNQTSASNTSNISDSETTSVEKSRSSEEYEALQAQHERLKEALVKLKDMAVEEKQAHERTAREMEQLTSRTIPSLEDKILRLSEQNVDYEEQIEILKANIDDSAELQEKFSDLFEKKLDLEEENKKLKSALKEMEALREVSEELEEAQAAIEARLKAELYEKQVEILDREAAIKNAKIEMEAQAVTIERLQSYLNEQKAATSALETKLQNTLKSRRRRRKLIDLDENNQVVEDLEDEEMEEEEDLEEDGESSLSHSSSAVSLKSVQQKESELQVILQKQAAKAASKALQDSLKEIERAQAIEQLALYQHFIPESNLKVDMDAIKCMLLMKRLTAKSRLAVDYLREQFHLESFERSVVIQEEPKSTKLTTTEELAYFAWNLSALVTRLGNNAAHFIETMKIADEATYTRFAKLGAEFIPYEKKLDHLHSLLQREELTVNYSLQDLEVILERFDHLTQKYCIPTAMFANQNYTQLSKELTFSTRSIFLELLEVKTAVNVVMNAHLDSSATPSPSPPSTPRTDLVAKVDLLSLTIVKYLIEGSRKLRRVAEPRLGLAYKANTLTQLRSVVLVCRCLQQFFSSLRAKIIAAGERVDALFLDDLLATSIPDLDTQLDAYSVVLPAADEAAGRLTKKFDSIATSALKLLFVLDEEIARGAHDNSGEVYKTTDKVIQGVPVASIYQLGVHASTLLEEVAAAAGLKGELTTLSNQLKERDTIVVSKTKEIEDLEWKVKKQEHRLVHLEKVEQDVKEELASHQKNYASQILNLETANRELTEKVEQLENELSEAKVITEQNQARAKAAEEQLASSLLKQQQSISLDSANTQIASLKSAVKHLSAQVSQFRSKQARDILQTKLPSLAIANSSSITDLANIVSSTQPTTPRKSNPSSSDAETVLGDIERSKQGTDRRVVNRQVNQLLQISSSISVAPVVVDITNTESSPAQQLEALRFEQLRVKAALVKLSKQTVQALADSQKATTPSHFSSFPTPAFVAGVNSVAKGPIKVGKLSMLAPLSTSGDLLPAKSTMLTAVNVKPTDLAVMHSLLVK